MVPFYVIGKVQYVFASRHPRRHSARSFSVTSFPYLATSLPPYLLFSDFSPATHFRRSYRSENVQTCQRSDVLTSFTAKSLPFNLFADSHPLTPVTSDFYKNAGGRGHSRRFLSPKAFPCHTSGNSPVSPLAATLMDLPASVGNKRLTAGLSPLDATLTKNRGVHPSSQRALSLRAFPAVRTFKRFDVQTFQRVSQPSPFLSIIYALSYTTGDTYPLFFQSLAHSFHRDGGCTSLCGNYKSWPQIVRGQPLSHNMLWSRRTKTEYPHRLVYPLPRFFSAHHPLPGRHSFWLQRRERLCHEPRER